MKSMLFHATLIDENKDKCDQYNIVVVPTNVPEADYREKFVRSFYKCSPGQQYFLLQNKEEAFFF